MAIPLRGGVVVDHASLGDVKLLRDGEHCRYLGIQVSVGDATKANWEACISSINARLHLARAKTNTAGQRAALAAAVIVPKIVFVARHVWPPTATVDQLQQLVKRFVWGKRDGKQVRAWMGEMQAELPVLEGGVAVPNIQAELLTMAAMAVGRWASGSTGAGRTIDDIIMAGRQGADVYLTPRFDTTAKDANFYGSTMWASGAAVVRSVHGGTLSAAEHRLVRDASEAVQTSLSNARWHDGEVVFSIDATTMTRVVDLVRRWADHRGAFCDEWLRHATLDTATWLHNGHGALFKVGDFARATDCRRTLGDVIEWSWSRRGEITFQMRESPDPRPSTRRAAGRLCETLLINFSQLLYRPHTPTLLRPVNVELQQHHSWMLTDNGGSIIYSDALLQCDPRTVASMSDCEREALADVPGSTVTFQGHPVLSRLVSLYSGEGRWRPRRKQYRGMVTRRRREKGEKARDDALARQASSSSTVFYEMRQTKWTKTQRAPGLSPYAARIGFPAQGEQAQPLEPR